VAVGGLFRALAARGDLWFDEIWSIRLAEKVQSPIEIITALVRDNNHILNTLWMYLVGEQSWWMLYRIPAVVAGIGAVILSGLIARRWGMTAAVLAVLLTGLSYPLIHYSSEARGYAPAIFFAFAALLSLDRFLRKRGVAAAACFAASGILGFFSHLLFIQCYAALLCWSVWRVMKSPQRWRDLGALVTRCHAAPLVALLFLYIFHIRYIRPGGGPEHELLGVIADTACLAWGLPVTAPSGAIALILFACATAWGLRLLWRRRSDLWVFFAVQIIIAPAVFGLLAPPELLYERYFLLPLAFWLLLPALALADLLRRGAAWRSLAALALVAFCAGNLLRTTRLLQLGRGGYLEALTFIAEHSEGETILIAGDHDFRHRMIIEFYADRIPTDKEFIYKGRYVMPREGADWYLAHSFDRTPDPGPRARDRYGNVYDLAASYPCAGLSGWSWFVYRRGETPLMVRGRPGPRSARRGAPDLDF
jgi:hypothetical protein